MSYELIEKEVWIEMKDYPTFWLSNMGRLKHDGRLVPQRPNKKTGLYQAFARNKKGKYMLLNIHRQVGLMFLAPPKDKEMQVRHISSDFSDNRAENLVWAYRGVKKNQEAGIVLHCAPKKGRERHYRYVIKQIVPHSHLIVATYIDYDELTRLGYKRNSITKSSREEKPYKGYLWHINKVHDDEWN